MENADLHRANLVVLARSTAHVMSVADLRVRLSSGHSSTDASERAA